MIEHLNQAKHNENFLSEIEKHSSNNYFDWKVVVVFYSALHYLRALEKLHNKKIYGRHKDLLYHINPKNIDAKMPIDQKCADSYFDLFNMSHISRYYGIDNAQIHLALMKYNLNLAKSHYATIKKYCIANGVK
jgi:hypothetical protein